MAATKPNILHIVPHDLGADLACLGHPTVKTPNLDGLAAEGARFVNHFCNSTPCSPARGCMQTGRYAHSNGLIGLCNFGWTLPQRELTVVDYLNDAGYETCHAGFAHERPGFHLSRHKRLLGEQYGKESWHCELVCNTVVDFLENRKTDDDPFYLHAGFFEVHAPWDRPEYQGRYNPDEITVPPFLPDNPGIREILASYYGSVEFMDECLGRVFKTLRDTGLDQDTIVVFTTDHGISFPRAKSTLYDPGMRIALLMRYPGVIPADTTCEHMTSHIDLLPSLLELVNAKGSELIQGRSFAPFLRGGDYEPNEVVFAERNFHEDFDPIRAVRSDRYKYIRNSADRCACSLPHEAPDEDNLGKLWLGDKRRPYEQLFDLEADPNEFKNLADDPAHAEVLGELRERLDIWMEETDDFMLGAYEFIHYPAHDKRV